MTEQADNAATQAAERTLRQVVDLTWENVRQILETLETLPTKDEVNARFDEVNARFDEVLKAIKEHQHG
jgi:DNA-binding transcriptional regulator GbsR (MarR family)